MTETIRTGYHHSVQDREEDGALHIEIELTSFQYPGKSLPDSGLFPKSLENQHGSNLLGSGGHIAFSRNDQQGLFGESGQ